MYHLNQSQCVLRVFINQIHFQPVWNPSCVAHADPRPSAFQTEYQGHMYLMASSEMGVNGRGVVARRGAGDRMRMGLVAEPKSTRECNIPFCATQTCWGPQGTRSMGTERKRWGLICGLVWACCDVEEVGPWVNATFCFGFSEGFSFGGVGRREGVCRQWIGSQCWSVISINAVPVGF